MPPLTWLRVQEKPSASSEGDRFPFSFAQPPMKSMGMHEYCQTWDLASSWLPESLVLLSRAAA